MHVLHAYKSKDKTALMKKGSINGDMQHRLKNI